jgi:hypothetical protein
MPRAPFRAVALAATLSLAACRGPEVPSPLVGQTRYTCCNMHYERTKFDDTNYQKGVVIPYGTPVQIIGVRKNSVTFQPVGHPQLTLVERWGQKTLSMDEYMNRIFLTEDPHTRVRPAAAPAGKKKDKRAADQGDKRDTVRKNIDQGVVTEGMTRQQVLTAIGYPPPHRTPSLDAPAWTYWENRWATFIVYFDGDKVSRVQR